jgi:hypothetical protein
MRSRYFLAALFASPLHPKRRIFQITIMSNKIALSDTTKICFAA